MSNVKLQYRDIFASLNEIILMGCFKNTLNTIVSHSADCNYLFFNAFINPLAGVVASRGRPSHQEIENRFRFLIAIDLSSPTALG